MKVFLENLELRAPHGVYEEERREGRVFRFDLVAEVDRWPIGDDPADILDYRKLASIVHEVVVDGPSRSLIETLAWDIMDRSFTDHGEITGLDLTIRKRATAVAGDPQWVGMSAALTRTQWVQKLETG